MKPKERLRNMDLTEKDIETIARALAYCAVNAGNGEFAERTNELYHRWRGDERQMGDVVGGRGSVSGSGGYMSIPSGDSWEPGGDVTCLP